MAGSSAAVLASDLPQDETILGFDETNAGATQQRAWQPESYRKVGMGEAPPHLLGAQVPVA